MLDLAKDLPDYPIVLGTAWMGHFDDPTLFYKKGEIKKMLQEWVASGKKVSITLQNPASLFSNVIWNHVEEIFLDKTTIFFFS